MIDVKITDVDNFQIFTKIPVLPKPRDQFWLYVEIDGKKQNRLFECDSIICEISEHDNFMWYEICGDLIL